MNERRVHRINNDVTILPAKDPTKCGFSIDFGEGVFICQLGSAPCERLSECAIHQSNKIVEAFNPCIEQIERYEKVERALKNKIYNK